MLTPEILKGFFLNSYQYIILGAGPSGLTCAHELINHGVSSNEILIIEKEKMPGGLCRSKQVDGSPLDIGGGHFLDTRKQHVLNFLFKFMPQHEWNTFNRVSKIHLLEQEIDYPIEANIWQLDKKNQIEYLASIAETGAVNNMPMPNDFSDWIIWKLGKKLAEDYMLPYNRKIWSINLNDLGTYWLHKLPDVSYPDILKSCTENKAFGTIPAHQTFLYPKHFGYGEIWLRMGQSLGKCLLTNCKITSINLNTRSINNTWRADTIINTIPWTLWPQFCDIPSSIQTEINVLKKIAIDIDYIPTTLNNAAHWIYEPNESTPHHRKLLRSNFYKGAKGYWTETNAMRSKQPNHWRHHNDFAYPVNTINKPTAISYILQWALANRIIGMGSWGKWEHMNSDVAVNDAMITVSHYFEWWSMAMKISLCLMVYNELKGCKIDIPELPLSSFDEIYAIDGGSTDGTVEYLQAQNIPVFQQQKKGLNAAYLEANQRATGDAVVVFFPKASLSTEDLCRFRPLFEQGYQLIIASRQLLMKKIVTCFARVSGQFITGLCCTTHMVS